MSPAEDYSDKQKKSNMVLLRALLAMAGCKVVLILHDEIEVVCAPQMIDYVRETCAQFGIKMSDPRSPVPVQFQTFDTSEGNTYS